MKKQFKSHLFFCNTHHLIILHFNKVLGFKYVRERECVCVCVCD
jgi:hypothetical protein